MKIGSNEVKNESNNGDRTYLLDLIPKERTNIEKVSLLTHYEIMNEETVYLHSVTNKPEEFVKTLYDKEYKIFDGVINTHGQISNFKFRLSDQISILNEVNYLEYCNARLPKELRYSYDILDEYVYIIRFFDVEKKQITEDEMEPLLEKGEMVLMEDDIYVHLPLNYKKSVQKYWTENPFKAIFKLKEMGFYLGSNDPDKDENIKIIEEYKEDSEIILMSKKSIEIGHINVNMAEISKIKIPFKISDTIRKEYRKRDGFIPRPPSIKKVFGTTDDNSSEFKIDELPDEKRLKLPKRPPKESYFK